MDLLRTLLLYMSVLLTSSAAMSPALTPAPRELATPTPVITATATATVAPTHIPMPEKPAATATRTPTLYVGDRGDAVRRTQTRLKELGYLGGKVDGIFGQQTKRAIEAFQKNNRLSVDGIVGPKTYDKLFNDRNVVPANGATAPTPGTVYAQVPVYYYSTTGALLNTDTVAIQQGVGYVVPNPAKIPFAHTLRSTRSVRVTVDARGVANPASVIYTYEPNQQTQARSVAVYYRSESNELLATDSVNVTYGQSMTVTANQAKVPQGYSLISAGSQTVTVSAQGVASPDAITFYYRKPAATNVIVPVLYRDQNGALIASESKNFGPGSFAVNANDALVPQGYTLSGARTQYVVISNTGTATPTSITFRYESKAISVSVPVKYVDQKDGKVLHSDTFAAQVGSNTITANDGLVPQGYSLVSARQVVVSVSSAGAATPKEAVFTYKKPATASLPIEYILDSTNALLASDSQTLSEGQTTIVAKDELVPGYVLLSPRSVVVTVDQNGAASPSKVQFRYKEAAVVTPAPAVTPTPEPAPTPTPQPAPTATPEPVSATVEVRYIRQDNNGLIGGEQLTLTEEGQHTITANDSNLAGFVRQGEATQTVTVNADGTASPNPVIFYYLPEATAEPTPTPTPEPAPEPTPTPTPEPAPEPTPTPTPEPVQENVRDLMKKSDGQSFGESFPVYTGPGTEYHQVAGASLTGGNAIAIYGSENNMALVSFTTAAGGERFGYVDYNATGGLPAPLELSSYSKVSTAAFTLSEGTDGKGEMDLSFPAGTSFTLLAHLGDSWSYVEIASAVDGKPARGFIPRNVY